MITLRRVLTAFAIVGLSTVAAQAQGTAADDYALTTLFFDNSVQQELKLDDEQSAQAKKLGEEFKTKLLDAFQSTQGRVGGRKRREAMRDLLKPINEETNKSISELLKPEQLTRYRQIILQHKGAQVFVTPEIEQLLKLTSAQKENIKVILEQSQTKTMEIMRFVQTAGDRQGALDRYAALRKETLEQVFAELTDEQKKSWNEQIGAPFNYRFQPPQR